jgi:hypothetical protein
VPFPLLSGTCFERMPSDFSSLTFCPCPPDDEGTILSSTDE